MDRQEFVKELSKLRPSSTFLTLHDYNNEYGELADYSIAFHISYQNALKRSILIMNGVIPENDLEAQAKMELLDSFNTSLTKLKEITIDKIDDAYTRLFDDNGNEIKGIKIHTESNTLHMYGFVVFKRILLPGVYPKRNKKPLTIAKDKLRRLTPVDKFRQFRITSEQVGSIVVEHLSLLPPEI